MSYKLLNQELTRGAKEKWTNLYRQLKISMPSLKGIKNEGTVKDLGESSNKI